MKYTFKCHSTERMIYMAKTTTIGTAKIFMVNPPSAWSKAKNAPIDAGLVTKHNWKNHTFILYSQYGKATACKKEDWVVGENLIGYEIIRPGSPAVLGKRVYEFEKVRPIEVSDLSTAFMINLTPSERVELLRSLNVAEDSDLMHFALKSHDCVEIDSIIEAMA
jgi:hypothetical protein